VTALAFFEEDAKRGHNVFDAGDMPYTEQANTAGRIIRTGQRRTVAPETRSP
jgi:hypothetical protein